MRICRVAVYVAPYPTRSPDADAATDDPALQGHHRQQTQRRRRTIGKRRRAIKHDPGRTQFHGQAGNR